MAWQQLRCGNGGIITHIDVAADGSMVCTTDSFSAYVWDAFLDKWVFTLRTDSMPAPPTNPWMGGGADDIKMDPQNTNILWKIWAGWCFKSVNKGGSWVLTNYPAQPQNVQASGWGSKTNGPYIAIDPNNSDVVYCSTTSRGLMRTINGTAAIPDFAAIDVLGGGLSQPERIDTTQIGTSSTTQTVSLGSKVFSQFTNLGTFPLNVQVDQYVTARSNSATGDKIMGNVTASAAGSFTLNVTSYLGTLNASHNDWLIYSEIVDAYLTPTAGRDTTSMTIGTGLKTFNNNKDLLGAPKTFWSLGQDDYWWVKVYSRANRNHQMMGQMVSAGATGFTINVSTVFGAGNTHSDWMVQEMSRADYRVGGGHCTVFDRSGSPETITVGGQIRTRNIYTHTNGVGTFRSTDGGQTWTNLAPGGPVSMNHIACDPFGVMWFVENDWQYGLGSTSGKYDPATGWNYMMAHTPNNGNIMYPYVSSVAVDRYNSPTKAQTKVCFIAGDRETCALTLNGGASWYITGGQGLKNFVTPPNDVGWANELYVTQPNFFFGNCDSCFGPDGKLWTGAEGIWWLVPPTVGNTITLNQQTRGIEEFIGTSALLSTPGGGGKVLIGTWDMPFLFTGDLNNYPAHISGTLGPNIPTIARGYSADYPWNDPTFMVAIIQNGQSRYGAASGYGLENSGYSINRGLEGTWTGFPTAGKPIIENFTWPDGLHSTVSCEGGQIAACSTTKFIWLPGVNVSRPKISYNKGNTWQDIVVPGVNWDESGNTCYWGAAHNSHTSVRGIESDKSNGDVYFINVTTDAVYKYNNAADTTVIAMKPTGFQGEHNYNEQFRSPPGPGRVGHMFFTSGYGSYAAGLQPDVNKKSYWTNNGWGTISNGFAAKYELPGFVNIHSIGFGKEASGQPYPAVYLWGWKFDSATSSYIQGCYRCINWNPNDVAAGTWAKLGESYPLNVFQTVCAVDGDKDTYGIVYMMTTASGGFYWTEGGVALPSWYLKLRYVKKH